jgi:hypothetical protein
MLADPVKISISLDISTAKVKLKWEMGTAINTKSTVSMAIQCSHACMPPLAWKVLKETNHIQSLVQKICELQNMVILYHIL